MAGHDVARQNVVPLLELLYYFSRDQLLVASAKAKVIYDICDIHAALSGFGHF